jgi:hypothetical protein
VSAVLAEPTRCGHLGLIRLPDTLDWGVPYRLFANCYGVFESLEPGSKASRDFLQARSREPGAHRDRIIARENEYTRLFPEY